MPVNIPRLRWWFAALAVALLVTVAGFYFYGRYRLRSAVRNIPRNLGVNIQQSTTGFTFSKSEGGRTIFTIHASQAVQYKQGGRAELKDVQIIVYGRQANRYDQIYGTNFAYDPNAGTIAALGEVHIDLEGNADGPINPDQTTPQELKNPIHLKTSGLVFNRNSGVAETKERLEFRVPQASGSAIGATYDSKAATLTLGSHIQIHANEPHPADITAAHGLIAAGPSRAVLDSVRMERAGGILRADRLTILLRPDNTIDRVLANGNVAAHQPGKTTLDASAAAADVIVGPDNDARSALLSGGVAVNTSGAENVQARAGKLLFNFHGGSRVENVHASENVHLLQQPARAGSGRPVEINSDAMDFQVRNGRVLTGATTSGRAEINVGPAASVGPAALSRSDPKSGEHTTVTAGQFHATFRNNHLAAVTGSPDAKIVMTTPGQPDKTSTSDRVDVSFAPAGGIAGLVQQGSFHYVEPSSSSRREAWADKASYGGAQSGADVLKLTGSPRLVEGATTTTADSMEIARTTGDASATGNVKTTYSELKSQPGGALLAAADPIHITGASMAAHRSTGTAVYRNARLWQGANVIEAPVLEFRREPREVLANGDASRGVTTVFVEQEKNGKQALVNLSAAKLTYTDANRQARFEGGVTMKGADTTVTAKRLDIYLRPNMGQSGPSQPQSSPSQLEKAVASGGVVIQTPTRRATGENLSYIAAEGKFVLTGGSPSIFDAEHGKITGDSLTFFQRDDRVLVESSNSPTVTRTRVAK